MAVVRPDNAQQARLLRLLRDDGPRSRAELGDAVELSRSRLAVELERLTALELVETGGQGTLALVAPFVPTVPGTDRYVDELR